MRTRRESTIKRDLYEYDLDAYDFDAPIVFTNKVVAHKWHDYLPPGTHKSAEKALPSAFEEALGDPNDPLACALYIGHHKRMEKDERRVMEQDCQRLERGAEKIFDQQTALLGAFWQRQIPQIVRIDNMQDMHELKLKRRLALEEISEFIDRYNRMQAERRKPSVGGVASTNSSTASKPPKRRLSRASRGSFRHAPTSPARSPSPPPKVWLFVPTRAFGVCMPPLTSRSEFVLPRSWQLERHPAPDP